ncbi:MAG: type II toxin-antitoxin system VapC family toxin [Methanobacteriaceae archaeon]
MIFLDANYIIALFIEDHKFNERAKEIYKSIDNEKIISRLVITEVITVLNIKIKADNGIIKKVYQQMYNNFSVIEDHYFHDKAVQKLLKYNEKDLSLFDCIYMVLMEELGINEIATFDEHFENREGIMRIY